MRVAACAALRVAATLAAHPGAVLRRGAGLVAELGYVGLGTSEVAPHHGDERFTGWRSDPVRRRAVQTWLAATGTLSALLDDADVRRADADRLRAAFAPLSALVRPVPPPATAPVVPDPPETAAPRGTPARPGAGDAVPGRDVAATPGAVVLRTPMIELLQYLPRTEHVREAPLLLVGPLAHRYWLADLAPGHSLVEYLVGTGQQVFALSWSDPATGGCGRDLDACAAAVLDAVEACARITRCPRVTLAGIRSGGLLVSAVRAHLAATGRSDRVGAVVGLGTAPAPDAGPDGFELDAATARDAASSAPGGMLDGDAAVRAWAWRRGGERVLPYAVDAHAADRLPDGPARRALRYWSADLLGVPAALHADLVALAAGDPERPVTVLGTEAGPHPPVVDTYLVTAADDPVQDWTAGHRAAQRLGGAVRLVLAAGDQAGALVAAPGAEVSGGSPGGPATDGFHGGPVTDGEAPAEWRAACPRTPGSWWPDLADWLAARSGAVRDAPPGLGGRRLHPVAPAPGTYVGPAALPV